MTALVQTVLVLGTLALVAYALRTMTLDRKERRYRVIADGEILHWGQAKEDAEWMAHDAERSGLYEDVYVERDTMPEL